MAQTEVLVKIDSGGRDQETGFSTINTDVSVEEAQRENGTGSVLPRDTGAGDQGNSQSSTDTTLPCHMAAVGKVKQRGSLSKVTILQMVILVFTIAALLCSLLISKLKRLELCGLPLWKWALMAFVLISGRLVSSWILWAVVYFVKRNCIKRKWVFYFVNVSRELVQSCLWLSTVLLVWVVVIDCKLEKKTKAQALPYITKILACFLVSYFIWLLKTLFIKVFVMSFRIKAFFEQITKAQFNQYVIENLSLLPSKERKRPSKPRVDGCFTLVNSCGFLMQHGDGESEAKLMENLLNENKKNISASIMKELKGSIRKREFLKLVQDSDASTTSEKEIKTEDEARKTAESIFLRVTKRNGRNDGFILLEDVKNYMPETAATKAMQIFQGADKAERVGQSSFCDWMVGAFKQRKELSSFLSRTKSAVKDLRTKLNIFTIVIIIIFWFFILGLRSPAILVYMAAQLVVLVFIFGNTCKTVFEGFVFLYVMHPFDVGDLCEVDGVKMVVRKMKILTTVFIREDNQKILFPNSALATKPITNYHRSKNVRDVVDITLDASTPTIKLRSMEQQIQSYAEGKGGGGGLVSVKMVAKDIGENNKVKMSVWVEHKMNNEKLEERLERRATLVQGISDAIKDLH